MSRFLLAALTLVAAQLPALAEDPLARANFANHISGPSIEPGSTEGKVVFLEYFGYR